MVSEWNQIIGTIRAIGIWDFVDIAIVAVLIYQVIKLIRETRAMQLAKGLLLLLLMYFVAYNLNMKTVRFIMQNLVATGVLALVIIFQPELRRMLEHVAQTRFNKLNIFQSAQEKDSELMGVWDQSIATIASACAELSRTKTGALIVAACTMGVIAAGGSEAQREAATRYADALGLAFQIRDDMLDAVGDAKKLGKAVHMDGNKSTFVTLYGLERCEAFLREETEKALSALSAFENPSFLMELTRRLAGRDH